MVKKASSKHTVKSASSTKGSKIGVAALATAGVAAVAGAIFLYGTDSGKKKRKQIKSWAIKARGEVLEKLEKAKEINEAVYNEVIKTVIAKYQKLKNVESKELEDLASDLKKGWNQIKKELKSGSPKKTTKK